MNRQILGKLLLVSCTLAGCASQRSDDVTVGQALLERDAAYVRLAKAITSYCAVSTETIGARQACILERRLSSEHSEDTQRIVSPPPSPAFELRSAR